MVYKVFGLNIELDMPSSAGLLGLAASKEHADVSIHMGNVPEYLSDAVYRDKYISFLPGTVLLKIPDVGRYMIKGGNEIIIQAEPDASELQIMTFAFGSSIGSLLYQRGILALHGSALLTPRGAVIFSGKSGAGKSTLAAALSYRGFDFVSDDICAIRLENNKPLLYPGLSNAKLCADSYKHVTGNEPSGIPISAAKCKYRAGFEPADQPCRLQAICFILPSDRPLHIERITGAERFGVVAGQVYRPLLYRLITEANEQFRQISSIAAQTEIYAIHRPDSFDCLQDLLDSVENRILT